MKKSKFLALRASAYSTLIFLLFSTPLFCQWKNCKEGNFRGPVKDVKMHHEKVIVTNDSVYGVKAADNDPFWFEGYIDNRYQFDKNGNTTHYHQYYINDADDYETRFIYREDSLVESYLYFADSRADGAMHFNYNAKGEIICVLREDAKGEISDVIHHIRDRHIPIPLYESKNRIWRYIYDPNRQCKEEQCYQYDGDLEYRNLLFYTPEGRQDRIVTFDPNHQYLATRSFSYDSLGHVIRMGYLSEQSFKQSCYTYDSLGNEITAIHDQLNLNGKEEPTQQRASRSKNRTHLRMEYKYDLHGNWTEKILFKNDLPVFMQKRQITYWRE